MFHKNNNFALNEDYCSFKEKINCSWNKHCGIISDSTLIKLPKKRQLLTWNDYLYSASFNSQKRSSLQFTQDFDDKMISDFTEPYGEPSGLPSVRSWTTRH